MEHILVLSRNQGFDIFQEGAGMRMDVMQWMLRHVGPYRSRGPFRRSRKPCWRTSVARHPVHIQIHFKQADHAALFKLVWL